MQIFKIAEVSTVGNFNVIDKKKKIKEENFWQLIEYKLKELTKDKPEKYDELLVTVKGHLNLNTPITIGTTQFIVKGKK